MPMTGAASAPAARRRLLQPMMAPRHKHIAAPCAIPYDMRCGSRKAAHSQSPNAITAPSRTAAPMAARNMRLIIAILPRMKRSGLAGVALVAVLAAADAPTAQSKFTTPKEAFGFALSDDYHLANYKQLAGYWRTLDKQSDR